MSHSSKAPDFLVVIPARLGSSRLPRKPLADIGGKPMVIRVAEQAAHSGAAQIIIATDHQPIIAAAKQNNLRNKSNSDQTD